MMPRLRPRAPTVFRTKFESAKSVQFMRIRTMSSVRNGSLYIEVRTDSNFTKVRFDPVCYEPSIGTTAATALRTIRKVRTVSTDSNFDFNKFAPFVRIQTYQSSVRTGQEP
jgi:hypothetical protein